MKVEVTRTYLGMSSPAELKGARVERKSLQVLPSQNCPPSFFRYLYAEVGRLYHWTDRLGWTDEVIRAYLADPATSLWVMYCGNVPAGYFELRRQQDGSVEIAYFGLLREFIGCGLGGHLLTVAVESAWARGARKVWLHTCTLDDPAAMPNYLKRGFMPFKQEKYIADVPEHS